METKQFKKIAIYFLASIICISLIHPPYSLFPFAFFTAFCLLKLSLHCHTYKNILVVGFFVGLIAENIKFIWIYNVDNFSLVHGLLLGGYLGFYYVLWMLVAKKFHGRFRNEFLYALFLGCTWVLLEWLLSNFGFLSFGWATLAHSQIQNKPLLQWASVTGAYGISFILVFYSVLIADSKKMSSNKLIASFMSFVFVFGVGAIMYSSKGSGEGRTLRVASIQPSFIKQNVFAEQDPNKRLKRLTSLSYQALKYEPDVLIWPEGSIRGQADFELSPIVAKVVELSNSINTPIIFGYTGAQKFDREESSSSKTNVKDENRLSINQAVSVQPRRNNIDAYSKRKLMPFAEYTPLEGVISWPEFLVPKFSKFIPGESVSEFSIGYRTQMVPVICWEILFSKFVRNSITKDSDLLMLLNNDNWFGRSAAGEQHNRSAVLRAVENGLPIVVSSNTGPTEIVDSVGRVLAKSENIFDQTFVIADVQLFGKKTIFSLLGDWFVLFSFVAVLVLALRLPARQSNA
jgi:apolipoprotein N-acyltransferase